LNKLKLNENVWSLTADNTGSIDIDFSKTTALKHLKLSNSMITSENLNKTLNMESLEDLDLSYNYIGELNISTFALLTNLTSLNLKATKISEIKFGTFSHQEKVERLNLADNNLGFFDLNMIYSLSNLVRLDISGNELTELANVGQAHHLFAQLQSIDITKNKFTCSTLMKLVRIFKTYKVAIAKSNIEHHETNIQGIICTHIDGEDDAISDLESSSNQTEIIAMIKQISDKVNSNSQTIRALNIVKPRSAALVNEKTIQVQNSTMMESSLIIVCICFTIFMGLKVFLIIKNNFLDGSARRGRPLLSQSLSMCADDV
jgi:Leucine-rich repeat (LRR) protein